MKAALSSNQQQQSQLQLQQQLQQQQLVAAAEKHANTHISQLERTMQQEKQQAAQQVQTLVDRNKQQAEQMQQLKETFTHMMNSQISPTMTAEENSDAAEVNSVTSNVEA